jgi:hypothetical protein
MSTTYNGWTNYATWRVNLELFDGVDVQDMGWDQLDVSDLVQTLKEYATEMLESEFHGHKGDRVPLALSYALAFLSDVNWREIAEGMLGAYADA